MFKSSYYDEIIPTRFFDVGAWHITVGSTKHDEWVAEFSSMASGRPQRQYFATEAEAVEAAEKFGRPVR
jgi:hypothetical protein